MAVQGGGPPPDRATFDKATVDRRQVFGGMAGVAGLLVSVFGGIKDHVPLSLFAAGAVTLVGVWLLYRWGRRPRQHLTKHFVLPVLLTVVGAATGGVLGGLELRPTGGSAQPAVTTTTATTTPTTTSATQARTDRSSTTTAPAADTSAAGAPGEFRSERIALSWSYAIDFDAPDAENRGVLQDLTNQAEIEYIDGLRGRDLGVVTGKPSQQDCVRATELLDYVPEEMLVKDAAFCAKTSEGRWSRFIVVKAGDNRLEFDLVVWEKQA
ncbi:hypothetical protein AB0H12_28585 [Actinosynnema sp. NPDC023794]